MKRIEPELVSYRPDILKNRYFEIGQFNYSRKKIKFVYRFITGFFYTEYIQCVFKVTTQTTSLAERMEMRRVNKLIEKMKQIDYYAY